MSTILVVDDDKGNLLIVRTALEEVGHGVLTTNRPEQALELLDKNPVDAAVLDVMMPGISGFELLESLRARLRGKNLPVLFLSSLDEPTDRVRGIRAGADDYMIKPFDTDELVARIDRLVASRSDTLALAGRLESFSAVEVLQNLYQGRKSGVLQVSSGRLSGEVDMSQGQIRGAWASELRGRDAVLTLLDLDSGYFHFDPNSSRSEQAFDDGTFSLNSLLLEAAWLEDELGRRYAYLPIADRPLHNTSGTPPTPPQELADLPFADIHRALAETPNLTLQALLDREIAARTRALLTVAVMIEEGWIETELEDKPRQQTPAPVKLTAGDDGTAHVVVLFDPLHWSQVLDLVKSAPEGLLSVDKDRLLVQLSSRGSGSVRLLHGGTSVLLHLQPLKDAHRLPGGTLLALASRIVIWHVPAASPQIMSRYLELVSTGAAGVILTGSEEIGGAEALLTEAGLDGWSVSSRIPNTIDELLGLAIEA